MAAKRRRARQLVKQGGCCSGNDAFEGVGQRLQDMGSKEFGLSWLTHGMRIDLFRRA